MTRTIAALCCLLMTLLAGPAAADSFAPMSTRHLTIEPIVAAAAPGEPVDIALVTTPEPGWHGYWGENPGDAGFPPKAEWRVPAGTMIGGWRWPVPTTLKIAGLMNYVYERPFAPIVSVRLPATARGEQTLGLHLSYLVCTAALCVPEDQDIVIRVPARAGVGSPALDRWRAALPRPLGAAASYAVEGGKLRLSVPFPAGAALDQAYFFPSRGGEIDHAAPQTVTRDGDRLVIETAPAKGGLNGPIEGVLRVGQGQGLRLTATPGAVPAAQGWLAAALLAFGGAVLGGLILNVMPCVFPILSLKALSLARSGAGAGEARREALAYTAGVMVTCLALGALVLALRAGGSSAGWAVQLQSPITVELLLLLTAAIAFNLAGLFELPTPPVGDWAGRGGAFATGALAAVIATPCTGPFMGAALGAALVLPVPVALAVFAGLGLGLALPFLAIGFVPALRRRLPKPGAWMEQARRLLSIPMFLTALALAWLLGRQAGVDAMSYGLLAALGLVLVLWGAGRRQQRGLGFGGPAIAIAVAVTVAGAWLVQHARATPGVAVAVGDEHFTEPRLAQLRAQGKPVFAYFTADWCLTCKVNERVAIEPARDTLKQKGVTVLVGDWTDGDPALGRFIQAHDRAGVPLYLYYPPGQEAQVLPQVLTPGMLAAL